MINYSLSTVLMAVLTSDLLIIIISLCFRHEKVLFSIGYRLVMAFVFLALIRFIFPIELAFARAVPLPEGLSIIIYYIRYTLFKLGKLQVSFWVLLECVWACGAVYRLAELLHIHVVLNCFFRKYGVDVTSKEPYFSCLRKVCDSHKKRTRVVMISGIDTPCQKGIFRPYILLPAGMNLSEEDLYFVMMHEMGHYRHRDCLTKLIVNIFLSVYWWNPFSYALRDQMDILMEMRVDDKIVKGDQKVRFAYIETLLRVGNLVVKPERKPDYPFGLSAPGAVGGIVDLRRRARMLYRKKKKSSILLSFGMLILAATLFVSSYCFIFEPYFVSEECMLETPEIMADELQAFILEDGSYEIYWNGEFFEHVDSLEYYPDVPIVK